MSETVGEVAVGIPAGSPAPEAIAETLARGGVLVFATESSYGLGVDPRSADGVGAIYRLKGRERGKPLPVVAADVGQLLALGVPRASAALAWGEARWPAALSVVLPLGAPIPASAGGSTIAARVPARESLRALLAVVGHALTATSANPSGEPPYTDPRALERWIEATGVPYLLVDEGESPGGAPSTLVAIVDGAPRRLRNGRYLGD
jgi:L-threonylcarbamoyladenylate synthase